MFKLLTSIHEHNKTMQELAATDGKRVESDFGDLAKVTKFKEAYDQSISEISRRREFFCRLNHCTKTINDCIAVENRYRKVFLKKYSTILLEAFVPELKLTLAELATPPGWSEENNLPLLSGFHPPEEVALRATDVRSTIDEEVRLKLESLERERNEFRDKISQLEVANDRLKVEVSMSTEKAELLSHVDTADTHLTLSSYYSLLDGSGTPSEKRKTIGEILKANAKQMYRYFGSMLVSRSTEIKELKSELAERKTNYSRTLEDHARQCDQRIQAFMNSNTELHRKEAELKAQLDRLRSELKNQSKEIDLLRQTLNSRKLDLDSKSKELDSKSRELLELKTSLQLLKGKYESLVQRQSEDTAARDGRREDGERKEREIEGLRVGLEMARDRAEKAEEDCTRLRLELAKVKAERVSKEVEIREIVREKEAACSNSSGGKVELLDEVAAKQAEIESLRSEISPLKKALDVAQEKIKGLEREVSQLQIALAASKKAASSTQIFESSSERQVGPTSNSRGSFLGGNNSSNAATQLLILQKDNELRELNEQLAETKREVAESQTLSQRLTKMLEDTQNSAKDREKRLQQRLEVKDSEISLLQRDLLERAENLEFSQREISALEGKIQELETRIQDSKEEFQRTLLLEHSAKDQQIQSLSQERQLLSSKVHEQDNRIRSLELKLDSISSLQSTVDSLRSQLSSMTQREEQTLQRMHQTHEELSGLRTQLARCWTAYQSIYSSTVHFDGIFKHGLAVFFKYAKGLYVPMVFTLGEELEEGEIDTRKDQYLKSNLDVENPATNSPYAGADMMEAYSAKLRRLPELVNNITMVLDMNSLPTKSRKLLESQSLIVVCRVQDIVREKVDLKHNKELVSFVSSGVVNKVQVGEITTIMNGSFENSLDPAEATAARAATISSSSGDLYGFAGTQSQVYLSRTIGH